MKDATARDRARITILGGGPAGLAVAHYAHAAGIPFVLFEASPRLGGLCRTFECGAHRYDSGAHRFHDRDAEITGDVRALLGGELIEVDSPSQILHRGRFIDFPPSPLNWIRSQGAFEGARIAVELLRGRLRPLPERSFEDVATNRYGRRLGKPLLLDYSEKLWGRPARELAPEVATRRLSGLTLPSLAAELVLRKRKSAHLDGSFLYPTSGYGAIPERLAAGLPAEAIRTNHEVEGLDVTANRVQAIRFRGRPPVATPGSVVSTLPLTALVRFLGAALPDAARTAASGLEFRHVRIVFLRLRADRCTPNATIYLPDASFAVSRISEPKNRSRAMGPADETSLVAEIPCSTGDPLASLDEAALAERVIDELASTALFDRSALLEWRHHFLANAYPVYTLDYRSRVDVIEASIGRIQGLELLGRGGRFWYSHLHDQMRAAKDYVRSMSETPGPALPSPIIEAHILRSAKKLQ